MRRAPLFLSLLLALGLTMAMGPTPHAAGTQAGDDHSAATDGDEHGSHAGGHEKVGVIPTVKQGLAPAITAIVVFGIVVLILATRVWPKVSGGLEDRATKIREEIAGAEAAREQAKDALEEYERNLAQARAESQAMLDETKAKQTELAAQLKAKADTELGQIRERAMRDIEAAKKAALNEIYEESINLATRMASKILQREVSSTDQQRLVEESLAEMQSAQA